MFCGNARNMGRGWASQSLPKSGPWVISLAQSVTSIVFSPGEDFFGCPPPFDEQNSAILAGVPIVEFAVFVTRQTNIPTRGPRKTEGCRLLRSLPNVQRCVPCLAS